MAGRGLVPAGEVSAFFEPMSNLGYLFALLHTDRNVFYFGSRRHPLLADIGAKEGRDGLPNCTQETSSEEKAATVVAGD